MSEREVNISDEFPCPCNGTHPIEPNGPNPWCPACKGTGNVWIDGTTTVEVLPLGA